MYYDFIYVRLCLYIYVWSWSETISVLRTSYVWVTKSYKKKKGFRIFDSRVVSFRQQPRSSLTKTRKALPIKKWEEAKLRLSGSRTQPTDKSPSVNAAMGCWRKLMNCQFYVMLKLLLSSSLAVVASMNMLTTGLLLLLRFVSLKLSFHLFFFFWFSVIPSVSSSIAFSFLIKIAQHFPWFYWGRYTYQKIFDDIFLEFLSSFSFVLMDSWVVSSFC